MFYFLFFVIAMAGHTPDADTPVREVASVTRTLEECVAERARTFGDSDLLYDLRFAAS